MFQKKSERNGKYFYEKREVAIIKLKVNELLMLNGDDIKLLALQYLHLTHLRIVQKFEFPQPGKWPASMDVV